MTSFTALWQHVLISLAITYHILLLHYRFQPILYPINTTQRL